MPPVRVVCLTDFGTADGYAAAMAGVIATAAPHALVEHASHDIPPGDIFGASLTLSRYAALYPPGTVHLVVVDPGVGTPRRALAATIDGRHFVAPDNGVLSGVLRGASRVRIVTLDPGGPAGDAAPTFHGRDVFAPAAAHLACREPIEGLGAAVHDPVLLDIPEPVRVPGEIRGEVVQVDRFGTLVTNIPAEWLGELSNDPSRLVVGVADRIQVTGLQRTFADVAAGEPVALIGSLQLLELGVRDGSAAEKIGVARGHCVVARLAGPTDP